MSTLYQNSDIKIGALVDTDFGEGIVERIEGDVLIVGYPGERPPTRKIKRNKIYRYQNSNSIQNATPAYQEGVAARKAGKSKDDCPYKHFGPQRNEWRRGWDYADMKIVWGGGPFANGAKDIIIQSISDQLKQNGVALTQSTINHLYRKSVAELKAISRAASDKNNTDIIQAFGNSFENGRAKAQKVINEKMAGAGLKVENAPLRDRAYEEGRKAARRGKFIDENPYPMGSEDFKMWKKGWEEQSIPS